MVEKIQLISVLTCPQCGFNKDETMPTESCQFFYECHKCKALIKPVAGDCCVYCSYGSFQCPPVQMGNSL
jgi:hypothetical protein